MKLYIENLGPIKTGEISLKYPLTILTGPNNTGKSYVSYLIYGLYKLGFSGLSNSIMPNTMKNMDRYFDVYKNISLKGLIQRKIEQSYHQIFASKDINPSVQLEIENDFGFSIIINELTKEQFNFRTIQDLAAFLEKIEHPSVYFFPAERTAIALLADEIIENKALAKDEIARRVLNGEILETIVQEMNTARKFTPKYPMVVQDYILFCNRLKDFERQPISPLAYLADFIETILTGKVTVSAHGTFMFKPKNTSKALDLHLTSSMVKSLSGLVVYLRYLAQKGDVVIIDEPELNLHPDTQRKVARLLALMANSGLQVIISTHSNYIIRELNNLISLHKNSKESQKLQREYGYKKAETLDYRQVMSYYFNNHTITPMPPDENGFEVPTIDEEIHQMNMASNDIYFTLNQ